MRSFLSAMVLAASFALLVPENGAQAVNARPGGVAVGESLVPGPVASERGNDGGAPVDGDAAVLLAAAFLGAVMARRLRAD